MKAARCIFLDNAATLGGAVFLDTYGVRPSRLSNVIMARNTATMGSALVGKQVQMVNATVARNRGTALAVGNRDRMEHLAIRLSNTILDRNDGGNCASGGAADRFGNDGHDIQFGDASCGSSISVTDPGLDSFFVPVTGSPALNGGNDAVCKAAPVASRDVLANPGRAVRIAQLELMKGTSSSSSAMLNRGANTTCHGNKCEGSRTALHPKTANAMRRCAFGALGAFSNCHTAAKPLGRKTRISQIENSTS